jgi:hypothetical protein
MNTEHTDHTENFTSIDDIIHFYTHTLNHNNQKKSSDRNDKTDNPRANDQK